MEDSRVNNPVWPVYRRADGDRPRVSGCLRQNASTFPCWPSIPRIACIDDEIHCQSSCYVDNGSATPGLLAQAGRQAIVCCTQVSL